MPNIIRLGGSGSGGGAGGDLNVYTGATPPEDKTGLFLQTEVEPSKIIFDQKKYGGGTWEGVTEFPAVLNEKFGALWFRDNILYATLRGGEEPGKLYNPCAVFALNLETRTIQKFAFHTSGNSYGTEPGFGGLFVTDTHIIQTNSTGGMSNASSVPSRLMEKNTPGSNVTTYQIEALINSIPTGQDPIIFEVQNKFYISHVVGLESGNRYYKMSKPLYCFDPVSELVTSVADTASDQNVYPSVAVCESVAWYIGGFYWDNRNGTYKNSNLVYGIDVLTGLTSYKSPAPKRFAECGAFCVGNNIVLMGGRYVESETARFDSNSIAFNHFWIFDVTSDLWTERLDQHTPEPVKTGNNQRYQGIKSHQNGDLVFCLFNKNYAYHRGYTNPRVYRIVGDQLEFTEILVTPDALSPSVDLICSDEIRLTMGIKAAYQQNEQTLNKIPAYINNGSGWEPIK